MICYEQTSDGLRGRKPYRLNADGSLTVLTILSSGTNLSPIYAPLKSWDYQTGNFSQWDDIHAANDNQPEIVTDLYKSGFPSSAKFTARAGKLPSWDTQTDVDRTEVFATATATGIPIEGLEQWFWWSTFFPPDIQLDAGLWLVYSQFHHSASTGNCPVSFELSNESVPRIRLNIRGGIFDPSLRWAKQWNFNFSRGQWIDHLIYVKWSSNPADGRFGLWLNNQEMIPASEPVANLYSSGGPDNGPQTNYLKQGIYRGRTNRIHTLYFTGTVRGSSKDSVLKYVYT